MSTPAQLLRQTAAFLLVKADEIDGKTVTGFTTYAGRQVTYQEAYDAMIDEWTRAEKPHEYVAPGQGVLRDQTGTGAGAPRCFVTHRAIIDAAERGDPLHEGGARIFTGGQGGWPGPDGKVFRMDDYKEKGPEWMHTATEWLWTESPHGTAWKASPAVQSQLPKNPDGSLAAPELHPITR